MTSSWQRGKVLTNKSWAVLRANPSLMKWPVLGAVAALPGVAIAIGGIVLLADHSNVAGIAAVVVGAYLAVFGGMLCSAALVAAADQALRGQPVDGAFGRATQHLGALAGWAVIQTVVGWVLQALTSGGSGGQGGTAGAILAVLRILLGALLSTAWALITFFVLPLVVLEGLGPVAAIKRSGHIFKERWGTQLLGGIRIGGMVFLFAMLPALIMGGLGVYLIATVESGAGATVGAALIVVGVIEMAIAILVSNALRAIFGVALLRWAESGETLGDFTDDELRGAVRIKGGGEPPVTAPVGTVDQQRAA